MIRTSPIGSGHHYFVADRAGAFAIEASGTRRKQVFERDASSRRRGYCHTNHCLDAEVAARSKVPADEHDLRPHEVARARPRARADRRPRGRVAQARLRGRLAAQRVHQHGDARVPARRGDLRRDRDEPRPAASCGRSRASSTTWLPSDGSCDASGRQLVRAGAAAQVRPRHNLEGRMTDYPFFFTWTAQSARQAARAHGRRGRVVHDLRRRALARSRRAELSGQRRATADSGSSTRSSARPTSCACRRPTRCTRRSIELAERLLAMAGPGFSKVFFTLGGAEANENAIKIAQAGHRPDQDDEPVPQLSRRVDGRARADRRLAAAAARAR